MRIEDIDFGKIGSQELDELIEAATAERFARVTHYAGDGCEVYEPGDTVHVEGVSTPIEDLADGDVYDLDDGESWRVDDIRTHTSAGRAAYHVTRTRVDN